MGVLLGPGGERISGNWVWPAKHLGALLEGGGRGTPRSPG